MQKISFSLENSIYKEDYITQAIAAFGTDFSLSFHGQILTITSEKSEEIQTIFDEFMNYVLALSNE